MPLLERAGTTIHYEASGQGPAIVFLHSFLCDGRMFAHQVAALRRRWRVINVDLRGHGRSGPALTPVTFYDFAEDVIAVLDAEGIEEAVWAGLSMGGFTALRAALTRPQRVAALVLMDTDAGAEPFAHRVRYALMRGMVRIFGPAAVASQMMAMMFGRSARAEQPALCEDFRQRFLAADTRSTLTVARALAARDDLLARLGEIDCRVLVIVGEEDMALPVPLSQRMADGIRGAELKVLPRVGHLSTVEAPATLTQTIESFVDALAQGEPKGGLKAA
jgi:pimeloyl-ACP methyl ester carboxylesterase